MNDSWDSAAAVILALADKEENTDALARLLAQLLPRFAWPPNYKKYFHLWENHGVHLTPVHFYMPIPDTRQLSESLWKSDSALPGIDMNETVQIAFLSSIFPLFRPEYDQFPIDPTKCPYDFYFNNSLFGGTDALALYCMVRHFQPKRILEVGSGFSSRISAQALRKNGQGELTCIEPFPDKTLVNGFPGLTRLINNRVQDVPLSTFQELEDKDILFIDSSHVVGIGGDVNYLFLEVLPRLKAGVVVHIHDISFPLAGRKDWVTEEFRFWTEQDLLQAFLVFNSAFEVLLCNSYLDRNFPVQMRETFPNSPWWGGGSFWMRGKFLDENASR